MADPAAGFTRDDLRASVAAGLLTEPQAAGLLALAEARHGARLAQPAEDEPFELFRGFAEIFVSVGLVLLLAGVIGVSALLRSPLLLMALTAGACWGLAWYFTLRRRMVLPSIVLVCGFAAGIGGVAASIIGSDGTGQGLLVCALVAAGLALWYRVFRLPFTMFLLGLTGLAAVAIVTGSIAPMRRCTAGRRCSTCAPDRALHLARWPSGLRPLPAACGSTAAIRTGWAAMPPAGSGCICWPRRRW
ncbi:hypothetical protein [Frigidibacter mobilis]|uniref:hypothetical protein n=1 Tax=Frigidibacter mobilis TaxID=1335048 RepID=UPI001F2E7C8D|nr:hypothetical protein [Frigidibacter mobilis]